MTTKRLLVLLLAVALSTTSLLGLRGTPPVGAATARAAATAPIAYRQGWNIYLLQPQSGVRQALTTDGRGYTATYYPWYQWSPDGAYLLVVRADGARHTAANVDLLLLQRDGTRLRTLVSKVVLGDFFPSWALDGDQVIYTAAQQLSGTGLQTTLRTTVGSVDVQGHTRVLWHYTTTSGCGGGTPVPAEQLRWGEIGPLGVPRSMQWSLARHLAVYSATCGSGLNVTDIATGQTRRLDPAGMAWSSAALSSRGALAVVATDRASGQQRVLLTTPRAGAPSRTVSLGELPTWAPDGQRLYFVTRTRLGELPFTSAPSGAYAAPVYASAIWQARADGTQLTLLLAQDAYAFGPVQVRASDGALVYSSVDNMTTLATHLPATHAYTAALLAQYGPQVRIQRYVPTHGITTVVRGAGNPALQP